MGRVRSRSGESACRFQGSYPPGRSPHQALDALAAGLYRKRVNWIVGADIPGFFDNLSYEWMLWFLEHRIADTRILRLIQKWLTVGVSEDGEWAETAKGTLQGVVFPLCLRRVGGGLARGRAIPGRVPGTAGQVWVGA